MPSKVDVSRSIGNFIDGTKTKASNARIKVSKIWIKTKGLNPFHVSVKPMFNVLHRKNEFRRHSWENGDVPRGYFGYAALDTARELVDWSFLYSEEELQKALENVPSKRDYIKGNRNDFADKGRVATSDNQTLPTSQTESHLSVISSIPHANEGPYTVPSFHISFVHEHNSPPSFSIVPIKRLSAVETVRNALDSVWNHSSSELPREASYIDLEEEFSKSLRQRESLMMAR